MFATLFWYERRARVTLTQSLFDNTHWQRYEQNSSEVLSMALYLSMRVSIAGLCCHYKLGARLFLLDIHDRVLFLDAEARK
jgi:hypothetical protein